MGAELYYSYALDAESKIIAIEQAQKGREYFCPFCSGLMITKQGNKRRWHFAHKNNDHKCSYESYLHKLAKMRVAECFNASESFKISFHPKSTCSITDCPLGLSKRCEWTASKKEFDLKQFYNHCAEEVVVDKYRADLLISNSDKPDRDPIFIEFQVSHKSSEEKLKSGYRIIEIQIESEKDINNIVSSSSICEPDNDEYCINPNEKIKFYNFKADTHEIPNHKHQMHKFRFWIDSKYYFQLDNDPDIKCLSQNSKEIENSIFRLESNEPINRDFTFWLLSESGTGIKYCTMYKFYKYNEFRHRLMCVLYKKYGTKQYPLSSDAMKCSYFKQIDYKLNKQIFGISKYQKYKITMKSEK